MGLIRFRVFSNLENRVPSCDLFRFSDFRSAVPALEESFGENNYGVLRSDFGRLTILNALAFSGIVLALEDWTPMYRGFSASTIPWILDVCLGRIGFGTGRIVEVHLPII